jgi:DNA-binding transcriptional ArsR family regulator
LPEVIEVAKVKPALPGCFTAEKTVYERQANICKAFANPVRLQILDMVANGGCPAGELQKKLGISKANLSQHISVLRSAGIIATRRDGQTMICSLAIPEVKQACQLVRQVLIAQLEDAKKMVQSA